MKKLGLFGGTFDPIHNGHLHIARAFADELGLDTVIFLPAGDPYHKNTGRTLAKHRLAMTELAVADDERFAVSDCDIVREGATYTFDTIQIFRQQFPQTKLYWLMGMDSLLQLHTWSRWQSLVKMVDIAVAAREGEQLNHASKALHQWLGQALQDGSLHLLQAPLSNISSTEIREKVRAGAGLEGLVDRRVERYIEQHGLYR
ncbi:nicotinate-nucleotide adenylyltransferase [Neisseria wadsworthii]|uniref:Probable nicotinate-nucleotide adenylyltransferase n=1 Tax=Neisseria wadsworthii 9715 TaxID=1030841 RepID=G4CTP1_9NEIS|nr:nicotinate-nucleotide adenylyltransferase [Neisseria wadsworthii]EGZ44146.1 nicotinate-nucleotide adenylyltransferase [Neisseria wadsworthii 9715]QMT36019.1 nicotinate-nucleotide adenylyltransferase [Neisseria wadsworthii]